MSKEELPHQGDMPVSPKEHTASTENLFSAQNFTKLPKESKDSWGKWDFFTI